MGQMNLRLRKRAVDTLLPAAITVAMQLYGVGLLLPSVHWSLAQRGMQTSEPASFCHALSFSNLALSEQSRKVKNKRLAIPELQA